MDLLNQIQQYWFIIVFVGGVIGSWVRYEAKLDAVKKEVGERKEDNDKEVKELRERMRAVEIKASHVDIISGDIKAINGKLDILLRKAQL